jgi:flagellar assembly protein FliH
MGRVIRAQRMGEAVVPAEIFSARREAAAIHERAQQEAEAVHRRAYEAGYAAGHAEAAKRLLDLDAFQRALAERTEREATRAVLLVAAELVGTTLRNEPDKILDLLRPHLVRMRRSQQLILRLHPEDAQFLREHDPAFTALCTQHRIEGSLTLQDDPNITRGGCLLESNLGELDARIETRLSLLAKALGLEPMPGPRAQSNEPEGSA